MKKINVLTLCSGYDSQFLACKRLMEEYPSTIEFDLVGWAEIDTWAIKAHNLIFPEFSERNYGDISTADWSSLKGKVDLMTYSTPCQSISSAGKQEGITEGSGTESALLWEVKRAVRELHPKYLLQENVKALCSQKFMPEFVKWQKFLEDEGYWSTWQVLNAKDYCVPQNRERVFLVSILKDPDGACPYYEFPEPVPLTKRLKDVLEKDVDESYYLRPEQLQRIMEHCDRKVAEGCGFKTNFTEGDGVSGAIKTTEGHREYDTYLKEPPQEDASRTPVTCAQRGREDGQRLEMGDDIANSLTTVQKDSMVVEPKIKIVGNASPIRENSAIPQKTREWVYDDSGIMGALTATDYKEPKIVKQNETAPEE